MRTHRQPERKIRTAREYPLAGWLFTAPATLGFLLFTVGPMLISLYYSFTSFDGRVNLQDNGVLLTKEAQLFIARQFLPVLLGQL